MLGVNIRQLCCSNYETLISKTLISKHCKTSQVTKTKGCYDFGNMVGVGCIKNQMGGVGLTLVPRR